MANREMGAKETLNRPEKVGTLSKHREEPDCRIPIEVHCLACTENGSESDAESGILGRGDTVEAAGSRHPCALQVLLVSFPESGDIVSEGTQNQWAPGTEEDQFCAEHGG